jgi:N-ethylmaleimide reductase
MLFDAFSVLSLSPKNRGVMLPMTRGRAEDSVRNDLMAEYFGQRGAAGLISPRGPHHLPMKL